MNTADGIRENESSGHNADNLNKYLDIYQRGCVKNGHEMLLRFLGQKLPF
jgi:hypothetical protein